MTGQLVSKLQAFAEVGDGTCSYAVADDPQVGLALHLLGSAGARC